jgi:hypothetical protein
LQSSNGPLTEHLRPAGTRDAGERMRGRARWGLRRQRPLWNVGAPDPGAAARSYNDEDTPLLIEVTLSVLVLELRVKAIRFSRLRLRVIGLRCSCLEIHMLTDSLLTPGRIQLPALGTAAVRRGRHRPRFGVRESLPHPQQVAQRARRSRGQRGICAEEPAAV